MLREKIVDKTMKPEMESTPRAGTIMTAKCSKSHRPHVPAGLHSALCPDLVASCSGGARLGARDQARRLPPDSSPTGHSGAIVHAPRVRLEPPLPADRRGRQQSAG